MNGFELCPFSKSSELPNREKDPHILVVELFADWPSTDIKRKAESWTVTAATGGPWCLTFALGSLGNLSFFIPVLLSAQP